MFLICGFITIALGILILLFLPDNPMSSRLSPQEKFHAVERIRSNKTGIENKRFNRAQMMEALPDPHVWLIVILMITASEINGALSNYQASIIKS
jgi:sugar phosphate permease